MSGSLLGIEQVNRPLALAESGLRECWRQRSIWLHTFMRPRVDCPLLGRRYPDPHVKFVNLSSGSEHAARGASTQPRCDIDDASLAVRERGGGRAGAAAKCPFLC